MDHLDNETAATEESQSAAESRDLDAFAQASSAADARLRGETDTSEEPGFHAEEPEDEQPQVAATAQQQAAPDLFASATPEQREYLQSLERAKAKAEQDARSANGRYAATQRQLADKERSFNEQLDSIKAAGVAGNHSDAADQLDDLDQHIEAMREDFPGLADSMQAIALSLRNQVKQAVEPLRRPVEQIQLEQHQAFLDAETDALRELHPDADQIVTTPEFDAWLAGQHQGIQALAGSDSASDAAQLLSFYKNTALSTQTNKQAQRQRQLADMAALNSSQGRATADNSDVDSLYLRAAKEADKRLTGR